MAFLTLVLIPGSLHFSCPINARSSTPSGPRPLCTRKGHTICAWAVPYLVLQHSNAVGVFMAASTLSRCEAICGYSGDDQHLGEYSKASASVSGDGALVDQVVGGSQLLTESLLDQGALQFSPAVVRPTVP